MLSGKSPKLKGNLILRHSLLPLAASRLRIPCLMACLRSGHRWGASQEILGQGLVFALGSSRDECVGGAQVSDRLRRGSRGQGGERGGGHPSHCTADTRWSVQKQPYWQPSYSSQEPQVGPTLCPGLGLKGCLEFQTHHEVSARP